MARVPGYAVSMPALEAFRPGDLALYHRNPRVGDVGVIEDSLRRHGQFRPIVVNRGTHTGRPLEVLAGNHTVKAIRNLAEAYPSDDRWASVDAYVLDVDDDQAARIVLVDNRSADLGRYDDEQLAELLKSLSDFEDTGYVADDLSDLLAGIEETLPPVISDPGGLGDDSSVPREPRLGEDGLIRSNDIITDRDAYEDKASRLVVMALPIAQFVWAQEKLAAYRTEHSLETNSDVLLAVLADYSGEQPPAADAPDPDDA